MAKQVINTGTTPNDGTGTPMRDAFTITNENFTEIYDAVDALPFPYTGDAVITGSLTTIGDVGFCYDAPAAPGVWSTSGNLVTPLGRNAGVGSQNASAVFGGSGFNSAAQTCTQLYDGSTWSASGALNAPVTSNGGSGTASDALSFGGAGAGSSGSLRYCAETFDGTSWSSGPGLITARESLGSSGCSSNSALAFGGTSGTSGPVLKCVEEYNGTSWASATAMPSEWQNMGGSGTVTNTLSSGGSYGIYGGSCNYTYNGTAWSSIAGLPANRMGAGQAGNPSGAILFGGKLGSNQTDTSLLYDGSAWSSGPSLSAAGYFIAGSGVAGSALRSGGVVLGNPDTTSLTEEFSDIPAGLQKSFDYSSVTGQTTVSCLIETSAERYKSNVKPLGSQLDNVMKLQPVEFDWKSNNKHDIGFIADSVEEVYPNLVSKNQLGEIEGMNYSKMVSALVKSIQEQQGQIEELKGEINKFKK